MEFKLPELGENIESGEIISVAVGEGDSVSKDQTLLEIEAGKATMEIPSPVEGTIKALHVKAGDSVDVGQLVAEIEEQGGAQASEEDSQPSEEEPQEEPKKEEAVAPEEQEAEAPEEKEEEPPAEPEEPKSETPEEPPEEKPEKTEPKPPVEKEEKSDKEKPAPTGKAVSAAPNVRALARELGLPIHEVPASAPDGHISVEDVKAFARERMKNGSVTSGQKQETRTEPMSATRKAVMKHMAHCWATIPHVTQHDLADITKLEETRKRYAPKAEAAGAKLTMTAILIKVLASALKVYPKFNCSIDPDKAEIHYKNFYNIGVAMDTPKGLLVPVIADGDKKNIVELAIELRDLAEKAREGKLSSDQLKGGTFTLTNIGIIGGSFFTPIVNAPEVAILGTGRAYWEPGLEDGQRHFRLPLSLSYDHRIIDGADGARFLRWVIDAMEEPMLISLQG